MPDDYDKLFFHILNYTGSATKLFADSEFDGFPTQVIEVELDEAGEMVSKRDMTASDPTLSDDLPPPDLGDSITWMKV